jgi:HlyD family secretion protein
VKNKLIFILALAGIVAGLASAHFYAIQEKPQPPLSSPAKNPYAKGLYSTGIVESYQPAGENVNIFPEVSGTITEVLTSEGTAVRKGMPLIRIDDSVQKAVVAQQKAQADAALALLEQLKAQPRKETLAVAAAQVEAAAANLKTSRSQFEKVNRSYTLDAKSVSRQQVDDAENTLKSAQANVDVAQKQYELTLAGAWSYDIRNQQHQCQALLQAYESAKSLLRKYTILAPIDGTIISIKAVAGSFVSAQGIYGTYTQGYNPVITMRSAATHLAVRCYIDEILIPRLPPLSELKAKMFVRGTNVSIPLEFTRIQPYVTPKIELSDQRTERVDVRVLPLLFRFTPPQNMNIYPGQLVDVYVEASR